jgi:hypothetical protein
MTDEMMTLPSPNTRTRQEEGLTIKRAVVCKRRLTRSDFENMRLMSRKIILPRRLVRSSGNEELSRHVQCGIEQFSIAYII